MSVSANMVMASLGEETRASCRGPANHNAVALILPHKAMLGFDGGAIGADIYCDRSGILAARSPIAPRCSMRSRIPSRRLLRSARSVHDGAALVGPRARPMRATRGRPAHSGALKGMRIGIIRESMVVPGGSKAEEPIIDGRGEGDQDGARRAARRDAGRIVRSAVAARSRHRADDGRFPARARAAGAGIHARHAVPARARRHSRSSRSSRPRSCRPSSCPARCSAPARWSRSTIASRSPRAASQPPANLDIATIQQQELAKTFRFHISQYLMRRAADWKAHGFTETLADWAALNARSKFWGDDRRAAFKNWEEIADPRNPLGGRQGVNERIMLRELLRRVDMMVILENRLDALVRLHTPWPPGKIGGAYQYEHRQQSCARSRSAARMRA